MVYASPTGYTISHFPKPHPVPAQNDSPPTLVDLLAKPPIARALAMALGVYTQDNKNIAALASLSATCGLARDTFRKAMYRTFELDFQPTRAFGKGYLSAHKAENYHTLLNSGVEQSFQAVETLTFRPANEYQSSLSSYGRTGAFSKAEESHEYHLLNLFLLRTPNLLRLALHKVPIRETMLRALPSLAKLRTVELHHPINSRWINLLSPIDALREVKLYIGETLEMPRDRTKLDKVDTLTIISQTALPKFPWAKVLPKLKSLTIVTSVRTKEEVHDAFDAHHLDLKAFELLSKVHLELTCARGLDHQEIHEAAKVAAHDLCASHEPLKRVVVEVASGPCNCLNWVNSAKVSMLAEADADWNGWDKVVKANELKKRPCL